MIKCCDQEMLQAGMWYHCPKCGKRLREHPHGKDEKVIAELFVTYVQDYLPRWKDIQKVSHELWRLGYYEDYEADLPKEWMPTDD